MNERIIKLDETSKNEIENLHYDIQTMQELLAYMLDKDMDINSGAGLKYQAILSEKKKLYEVAKLEVTDKYIPSELKTTNYFWDLNFKDSSLIIRKKTN